ncbi:MULTISPECIES: hypothetical protein [Mycobacterium]|uniref:hypothetical protein n=1 Tax=Mycobacterium TaxID=1763 RepID=UPI001F0CAA53|nr:MULTISPECIES: hypothetical protein [Mycobacterium]MDM4142399.1 hypothetical protein [Mycobacterium sp. FLAC0960]
MARECDGPDRVNKNGCPLQCRLRYGATADEPVTDRVDWAGLPVNLDFAFSRDQRDKVYAQHLLRRRGTQFGPWRHGAHVCVCEAADEHQDAPTARITSDSH